jgi:hypothetical protein
MLVNTQIEMKKAYLMGVVYQLGKPVVFKERESGALSWLGEE